jgi:hypothetical protein
LQIPTPIIPDPNCLVQIVPVHTLARVPTGSKVVAGNLTADTLSRKVTGLRKTPAK